MNFETGLNRLRILLLVATTAGVGSQLSGCGLFIVGGAATSAVVANDRRTTGTFIEDQSIELKAYQAIGRDEELHKQSHISITSYNQVVLVSGQTPTEEMRQRAVRIVAGLPKVRHVHNELVIASPSSTTNRASDTLVGAKVKTRLFTIKNLDATHVKVVTENGIVYLMGLVAQDEGRRAAEAASRVSGVRKVVKLFEYTD